MRNLKIDFFRGLALIIIFIDHVYDNRLGGYTMRGYGIADAAEIFFFCSGFVAALVYEKHLARAGFAGAQWQATRRAGLIYVFHVAAFFVLLTLSIFLKDLEGVQTVLRDRQLYSVVYEDPAIALGIFSLQYQPFLFTILPAYIVLSLATPLFALMLRRSPLLLFGVSLAIYILVQLYPAINLVQGQHGGPWVFNPFAYQFLFVIGMLLGYRYNEGSLHVPLRHDAVVAAVVLLGAVFVFHNFIPFLQKHFQLFPAYPYPRGLPYTGKVNEEPLRIVHFLVLTYVVMYCLAWISQASPGGWRRLRMLAGPVVNCGQSSIQVFSLGIVLAYIGGFVIASRGNGAEVWIPVNLAGITILLGAGSWLVHRRRAGQGGGSG